METIYLPVISLVVYEVRYGDRRYIPCPLKHSWITAARVLSWLKRVSHEKCIDPGSDQALKILNSAAFSVSVALPGQITLKSSSS